MKSHTLPADALEGYYLARFRDSPFSVRSALTVLLYDEGVLYSFGTRERIDPVDLEYIHSAPLDLEAVEALLDNVIEPESASWRKPTP